MAEAQQQAREIAVGRGDFGAAVHQEDDVGRAFQGEARLLQDLAGDVLGIVHHDAAGIDQLEAPPMVVGEAVQAVAGDAGSSPTMAWRCLVMRLNDVGPAHDDHCGEGLGHVFS